MTLLHFRGFLISFVFILVMLFFTIYCFTIHSIELSKDNMKTISFEYTNIKI